MTDTLSWPVMGQAAASHAARVLACHAAWQLAACAPYHGLPLAGFLHDEASALLVAATDRPLSSSAAIMHAALLETRSDGLIIREAHRGRLPQIALGLWWRGQVAWHLPMLPWLSEEQAMWLVPAVQHAHERQPQAYRLVTRHMRGDLLPWRSPQERRSGFARAALAFAGDDATDRSSPETASATAAGR